MSNNNCNIINQYVINPNGLCIYCKFFGFIKKKHHYDEQRRINLDLKAKSNLK